MALNQETQRVQLREGLLNANRTLLEIIAARDYALVREFLAHRALEQMETGALDLTTLCDDTSDYQITVSQCRRELAIVVGLEREDD